MTDPAVEIALRIPGQWGHPKELLDKLPASHRLTPESLFLPDGTEIGFGAQAADTQFAKIFRSSCRRPATADELAIVDHYTVNVFLSAPGGSLDAARTIMRAAAAILRAGGGGVFNDNSGLAHGTQAWHDMTDDASPDAVSFAFVSIVRGKTDVYTTGMHVLGLREVVMKRADAEDFDIVEVIRYLAQGDKPIDDGHVLADLDGPRFQIRAEPSTNDFAGSPMYNPYGRFKLVSFQDVAEKN